MGTWESMLIVSHISYMGMGRVMARVHIALRTGKIIEKDYQENMGHIKICLQGGTGRVCDSKFKSY